MATGVNLSANDAMWLNMDTPANLMVIETVMWFDRPIVARLIREVLTKRMIDRFPVFTWRAASTPGPIRLDQWQPDPDFDIARHVTSHRVTGADEREAVLRFVSTHMSVPLDRDRPLWHAHIINGHETGALMLRLHHAIADGAALVEILMSLTDGAPEAAAPAAEHVGLPRAGWWVTGASQELIRAGNPRRLVERGASAAGRVVAAITDPMLPISGVLGVADRLLGQVGGTADAVDSLLLSHRPNTALATRAEGVKQADWCPPLPLDLVKARARAQGATVNDVLIAGLAGALRRYCLGRGEHPANLITMVPVNLRPAGEPLPEHLGNRFALVAVELPLAATTGDGRLAAAKLRMDVIKAGPQASLTYGVSHFIGTLGTLNAPLSRHLIDFFSNKAIGVTTNVIGPRERRWLAGAEMLGVLGWVPTAGEQSLGVCIFSYNNQVWVGFKADTAAVPDVGQLVAAFHAEMSDLLGQAGN